MTHRIKAVKPKENYILSVTFQNGVVKEYDMKNILEIFPQYEALTQDDTLYNKVQVDTGGHGISWNDELDLEAEELWEEGNIVSEVQETGFLDTLAVKLIEARNRAGMTQKQLAEITGIYQADISRIERGLANPSVRTLQRLAQGLGMEISVEFIINERKSV